MMFTYYIRGFNDSIDAQAGPAEREEDGERRGGGEQSEGLFVVCDDVSVICLRPERRASRGCPPKKFNSPFFLSAEEKPKSNIE